jgi:hypothetical protein
MLYMAAPERKGTYLVKKPFRFAGRRFEPGMLFNARREDPNRGRLDALYRDEFLSLQDEEQDMLYRMQRQNAIDNWQPPQPIKKEVVVEEPAPEVEDELG